MASLPYLVFVGRRVQRIEKIRLAARVVLFFVDRRVVWYGETRSTRDRRLFDDHDRPIVELNFDGWVSLREHIGPEQHMVEHMGIALAGFQFGGVRPNLVTVVWDFPIHRVEVLRF